MIIESRPFPLLETSVRLGRVRLRLRKCDLRSGLNCRVNDRLNAICKLRQSFVNCLLAVVVTAVALLIHLALCTSMSEKSILHVFPAGSPLGGRVGWDAPWFVGDRAHPWPILYPLWT